MSEDPSLAKARDLQSASNLEQFMAKLCLHHQRQIVNALGFLQTEVKAVASSSSLQIPEGQAAGCSYGPDQESSREVQGKEIAFSSTARSMSELRESAILGNSKQIVSEQTPYISGSMSASGDPPLDLRKAGFEDGEVLSSLLSSTDENENIGPKYTAPLIMKNTNSSNLEAKNLSGMVLSGQHIHTGTLEERLCNPATFLQTNCGDLDIVELSSPIGGHEFSNTLCYTGQRISPGHTKDIPVRPCPAQRTSNAVSPVSPRTARKSWRGSYPRPREGVCHIINDPDIHCDIVYIGKPITECQLEPRNRMLPRQNARKSTRGHMYIDEVWELKTVRTLARKSGGSGTGNCPAPMPEITLITPKQALPKPDGVPPVDMPFAGGCGETVLQKISSEQPMEREMPGDVVNDLIVETIQTGQTPSTEQIPTYPQDAASFSNQEDDVSEQQGQGLIAEEHFAHNSVELANQEDLNNAKELNENAEKVELLTKQSEDNPSDESVVVLNEPQCDLEDEGQNLAIEPPLSTASPTFAQEDTADAEMGVGNELEDQILSMDIQTDIVPEKSENAGMETQAGNEDPRENEIVQLENPCGMETNYKPLGDDDMVTEEKKVIVESSTERVDEIGLKESLEGCFEKEGKVEKMVVNAPESISTKKGSGRHPVTSDRRLRSKASTSCPEPTKSSVIPCQPILADPQISAPQVEDPKSPESKRPLRSVKLKPAGHVGLTNDCQNAVQNIEEQSFDQMQTSAVVKPNENSVVENGVQTRQKHKTMLTKVLDKDGKQQVHSGVSNLVEGSSSKKDEVKVQNSPPKRMTLRKDVDVTAPVGGDTPTGDSYSSVGTTSESCGRMPLRSGNSSIAEQPISGDSCSSSIENISESVGCMPLISGNSSIAEQPISGDSCRSSIGNISESAGRMPLRSSNSSVTEQPIIGDSCSSSIGNTSKNSGHMPLRSGNNSIAEQPISGDSCSSSIGNTSKSCGRMPLRSGNNSILEQPISGDSCSSSIGNTSESAGRMPLRSSNSSVAEQPIIGDSCSSSIGNTSESTGRMPLRSGNNTVAEQSVGSVTTLKNKILIQRPQRLPKPAVLVSNTVSEQSHVASPIRLKAENNLKAQIKDSASPANSVHPLCLPRMDAMVPRHSKFLEALRGEEHQQLITNLNTKFDKMQKGWVQMDKEGQPAPRPKNKADRLKEIWKSKRRIRKPRLLDQQKFSPVQMLFMKSFDLPSICRWFLQSTETKSLVIVKKVNTRLPSETQLCFHSSSAVAGSSHGVFPSLQAERLKKHLKKFAIASPVKSNPKSQKLIAKALEQDLSGIEEKEKRELTTATRISTKPHSYTGVTQTQVPESQKAPVNAKNPTSARILRKYSNIREKMQVQQNTLKCKDNPGKDLKGTNLKPRITPKSVSKQKLPTVQGPKSKFSARNSGKEPSVAKKVKVQPSPSNKTAAAKTAVKERVAKSSVSRTLRNPSEKNGVVPKRSSQSLAVTKVQKVTAVPASTTKTNIRKKEGGVAKSGVEKSPQTKAIDAKVEVKKPSHSKGPESLVSSPQTIDVKPLSSQDQVLTRSQRKLETTLRQSGAPKSTTKRTQDPIVTPVKRTRTSLSK